MDDVAKKNHDSQNSVPTPADVAEPTVLARALYDNCAEVAQELNFSRGDVLMVLKKDPAGFEGWWICSLAGKVGIAPGNRLELLGAVKVGISLLRFLNYLGSHRLKLPQIAFFLVSHSLLVE